jgi:hypothetical protein
VEFKMDKTANIGVGVGKRSFTPPDSGKRAAVSRPSARPSRYVQGPVHQERHDLLEHEPEREVAPPSSANTEEPDHESRKTIPDREVETHLKKSDYVILANFRR